MGLVHSKVPYSGCKAEEALLPAPALSYLRKEIIKDALKKGIANERRICVPEIWSGVTILNLLFSSPLFFFLVENLFLFLYCVLFRICSSRALFLIRV